MVFSPMPNVAKTCRAEKTVCVSTGLHARRDTYQQETNKAGSLEYTLAILRPCSETTASISISQRNRSNSDSHFNFCSHRPTKPQAHPGHGHAANQKPQSGHLGRDCRVDLSHSALGDSLPGVPGPGRYAAGPADCLLDRAFQQSGACSFLLLLLLPLLMMLPLLLKTVQAL